MTDQKISTQSWKPVLYEQQHSYVYAYGEDLLLVLSPRPGERILDLGCGTGHLTALIADSGAQVLGIDSSPEMVEAARQNHPHLDFRLADATDFSFDVQFDAVFSNAVLHWVLNAEGAVICMARALRSGGRLVAEFGGRGNVGRVVKAVAKVLGRRGHDRTGAVWYFPSIGEYASLLEKHQLIVGGAWLFDRPTKMEGGEGGLRSWLEMFGGRLLDSLEQEERQRVMSEVESELSGELFKEGNWYVDYRRLRIVAEKR